MLLSSGVQHRRSGVGKWKNLSDIQPIAGVAVTGYAVVRVRFVHSACALISCIWICSMQDEPADASEPAGKSKRPKQPVKRVDVHSRLYLE